MAQNTQQNNDLYTNNPLIHRDRRLSKSHSAWVRSFSCEELKPLIVCRGPIRKEAIDVFEEMGIDITRWNTVATRSIPLKNAKGRDLQDEMGNPLSRVLITDQEGVFAGGDAEIGPLTVVACVGSGQRAARVIQRYLEEGESYLADDDLLDDILTHMGVYDKEEKVAWLDSAGRENQEELHGPERASPGNYCEVELGLSDEQAIREAERCLRCYRVAMFAV